jgi:hypothetical protein
LLNKIENTIHISNYISPSKTKIRFITQGRSESCGQKYVVERRDLIKGVWSTKFFDI